MDPDKAAKLLKYELAPGNEALLEQYLSEQHRAAEIRMASQRQDAVSAREDLAGLVRRRPNRGRPGPPTRAGPR